ncbi:HEAT repeat domain-containing protein [Gemmata sp. JC673]|uniref:HEAT repeat domain-containing protein n=1 Tax=Gemmata algarum TaxID=2975278 RepID=A0ABU5F691_9BACT|nr:HEAT repeat domain-containing protein [Gemmata algarum]MDY3561389.1 HEAT repeat domain-containing protein [Gemmata algarum]
MLDGLDAVGWSSLTHAYGEATDVPELLRALASPDPQEREEASDELLGNIWHQGTVYPASAAAVPFLYELLTAPEVQDKSAIALLLACVATGAGYLEVHAAGPVDEPVWRDILSKQGKTLERELEREAAEVGNVRRAASVGLRHLLPYLNDPDEEVRQVVATALGRYPEHAGWAQPAIEAALASERDEDVRAALIQSQSHRPGAAHD